jgi:hypothetical protein
MEEQGGEMMTWFRGTSGKETHMIIERDELVYVYRILPKL